MKDVIIWVLLIAVIVGAAWLTRDVLVVNNKYVYRFTRL